MKIVKLDKDRYMATISGGLRNGYFVVYEYGETSDEAKEKSLERQRLLAELIYQDIRTDKGPIRP